MDVSEEMDDDFIHKQLEEPVFSHYEYVNKKLEAPPPPTEQPYASKKEAATVKEEAFELDMEDIDKELEMALTRKKASLVQNLQNLWDQSIVSKKIRYF